MSTIYKPILYSTPMVIAHSEGRKTQTRRTHGLDEINTLPDEYKLFSTFVIGNDIHVKNKTAVGFHVTFQDSQEKNIRVKAKYAPGDILWVRETFIDVGDQANDFFAGIRFHYKADDSFVGCWPWKPSIHMPKKAARIFLEVTNVRCERLHDISEDNAIAEGVSKFHHGYGGSPQGIWWKDYLHGGGHNQETARKSFIGLWKSINGKDSWKANPWVWVYEYKKIEKPEVWPQ